MCPDAASEWTSSKTNIEKIGGTVDVSCVPGLGTPVRMEIPLTLAIIPR
jgi:two-component system chemotaxis sensor kinase CheA